LEADPSQLGYGVWLIIRTDDSTLIGNVGFFGKSGNEESLEIGYEVLSAYRNQGYATEVVTAMIDFAFTQLQIKQINAYTPKDNVASIQIMKKLGMQNLGLVKLSNIPAVPMLKWELRLESINS
jgi:[ribosomal protein S5]-alanine N-acetyltransferase